MTGTKRIDIYMRVWWMVLEMVEGYLFSTSCFIDIHILDSKFIIPYHPLYRIIVHIFLSDTRNHYLIIFVYVLKYNGILLFSFLSSNLSTLSVL